MDTPWLEVLEIFQTCSLHLYKYVDYFHFNTFCMESMLNMLSQHTVYPQPMLWIFLFLPSTQPWLCLLGFQALAS